MDGRRCVVFFDEFQELAGERRPYGDPDAVTKRMRAIFQRSSQVSYLFTGSLEHVMRDLFAPGHRALSGFGSFYHLRAIAPEEWGEGLRERSSHRQALKIARRVAVGATLTEGMHRGEADRALRKLQEAEMIERTGHGEYRILNPLLRRRLIEQRAL